MAAYNQGGHLTHDLHRITNRCSNDQKLLYNTENSTSIYIDSYILCELNTFQIDKERNIMLNEPINFHEVTFAIC